MAKPTKEQTEKANAVREANRKANPRKLSEPERAFCYHYIGAANFNGAKAYSLAYNQPDMLKARRAAYVVLQRERVIKEIERLIEERNTRLAFTADDVLRELLRLKTDVEIIGGKSAPAMRTRLDVLKTIGEHVAVGAFRRQVGLSSPTGGPIETVDLAMLAKMSDEELDEIERARTILDRLSGRASEVPDGGGDQGGERAAEEDPSR